MTERLFPEPEHQERCNSFIKEFNELLEKYPQPDYLLLDVRDAQKSDRKFVDFIRKHLGSKDILANLLEQYFLEIDKRRDIESVSIAEVELTVDCERYLIDDPSIFTDYLNFIETQIELLTYEYDGVVMSKSRTLPDFVELLKIGETDDPTVHILFFSNERFNSLAL